MDAFLMPALIVGAFALMAWWAVNFLSRFSGEKRKLAQRLNTETRPDEVNVNALSIVLPDEEKQVPKFLARNGFMQTLGRRLAQSYPETPVRRFLVIVAACSMIPAAITVFITGSLIGCLAAGAVGGYLPLFVVNMRCNKRIRTLTQQLPEALDFLSRIMRAGHSLSTGLQMMGEELPAPLSTEFQKAYDQHSLGQALEESLKDMSARIDSTDFAFFVTAVLIQRQTGGDLSEVLKNISALVRSRLRLGQQVRAKTAEGRFTGYIMAGFPVVMFGICYYLNPDLYSVFFNTSTGMILLGTAGGLTLLGLFVMKQIVKVKV
ncbi:MAG: Flp pilus assembly protein TadB [Phycisphaerales bacterium]|nr:Flp pilus assembly protein TadB [Phycisphaerales bacterium]MDB5358625.1 Flp pilus assembly protein TadB [Phycisphaerales bacterium]